VELHRKNSIYGGAVSFGATADWKDKALKRNVYSDQGADRQLGTWNPSVCSGKRRGFQTPGS